MKKKVHGIKILLDFYIRSVFKISFIQNLKIWRISKHWVWNWIWKKLIENFEFKNLKFVKSTNFLIFVKSFVQYSKKFNKSVKKIQIKSSHQYLASNVLKSLQIRKIKISWLPFLLKSTIISIFALKFHAIIKLI